ncbi:MAG: hypothetical protein ABL308_04435 [Oceanicaulis sp.]
MAKSVKRSSGANKKRVRPETASERAPERAAPRLKDRLLSQAASFALGTAIATGMATAATVATATEAEAQAIGDPITNPISGGTETVAEVVSGGVITEEGNFIFTGISVGAIIPNPFGAGTAEVAAVSPATGTVTSFTVVGNATSVSMVTPIDSTPGQVAPPTPPTPGAFDINFIRVAVRGGNGSNGRGGALFIPATSGGNGGSGPTLPRFGIDPTGTPSYALGSLAITTVTNGLAGIEWSSAGGNGGNGGGSTFNLAGGGKSGGKGGAGGNVTLSVTGGNINTSGNEAHGVVAQSRSGVGGQGGSSFLATGGGGDGGAGNDGGNVSLTVGSTTNIRTTGDGSVGAFAQSLGGGAGAGGSSYNLFAFGGGAKDGGDGGNVTLDFAGTVRTQGLGSHGVFAQSLGGTGGQAGNAGGLLAFGDNGSGGGNGRTVNVTVRSTGFIETDGFGSHGVFAQSVGGGGGSSATSAGLGSFGANGGTGGNGGSVTLTTEAGARINTLQGFSHGVFAQSVGGGGGAGGTTVGAVSLGAGGGGGGSASSVTVNTAADITTDGIMSRGVFAQSVGGGGGSANAAVGLLAIGGNSSDGGAAGNVTVNASGAITTDGALSNGILAQSVGGGGGDGGMAVSGSAFAGLAVGGRGGGGGDSGIVTLRMSDRTVNVGGTPTLVNPAITTSGILSRGVHLQSVGGGGGNGGLAVQASVGAFGAASFAIGGRAGDGGDGGLVRMFGDLNVQTEGFGADGVVLQSVGGGGGTGGGSVSVAVSGGVGFSGSFSLAIGGSGGQGGDSIGRLLNAAGDIVASGGDLTSVFMDSGGFISTDGLFATGLFAQSIGGGGGGGGFSVAAPLAFSDTVALSVGVGVGGAGGLGGDGGRVDVTFDGGIQTLQDDSIGALIQSTGGGGGNGGFNVTASLAGSGVASGAVSVGVGGGAGNGGDGGTVIGRVLQTVSTQGERSNGVIVQSTGGGGGNGGFNVSGNISASGTAAGGISVGVGGSGGDGGDGGSVNAVADNVTTSGEASSGFLAQSVGGGGGNGGFNVSAGIAASSSASGAINVGVGGSGGAGGLGGNVNATLQGDITTTGYNSDGVIAQSIGGGGGNGAFNVSAGISASTGASGNIGIGVGGSGGSGGRQGGTVTLTLDGDQTGEFISVSTGGAGGLGAESDAILAQSVGGGGGNGGFNVTAGVAVGAFGSGNIGIGVGGSGGSAGIGGAVTLLANQGFDELDGMLATTTGARSRGVVAQSVGGGGGNGGFNVTGNVAVTYSGGVSGNLGIGVGGAGGSGGAGGAVTADITGGVMTGGDNSGGIEISSLGGGGGSGAFNITAGVAVTAASGVSGNIGIGVGGSGGGGGSAGTVNATANTIVDTFGRDSDGAVFQSVGGGGGNGGFNVTGGIAVTAGSGVTGNIGVGVGGSGGDGGDGGTVDASLTGLVLTRGEGSDGVIAQSLGGGGGSGGFNVTGSVGVTAGSGMTGSIGVGIGGKGGLGGDAGAVDLTVLKGAGIDAARGSTTELAVVRTLLDRAKGVVAQSLGGAGGNGGFNITGDVNITAGSGATGSIGVGVGGFGGGGGDAGDVGLTLVGDVQTGGAESGAIEATSSGGGGGSGGFNINAGVSITTGSGATGNVGVGIGGFGGDGGDAGDVTADVRSDVLTVGARSDGALFQSTGGGGGSGAFNITGGVAINAGSGAGGNLGVGIGGFGGEGGDAGDVIVDFDGTIQTGGLESAGVTAQSVGGSGGNGAFNITGGVGISKSAAGNIGFGLGGFGGGGGDAGDVTFRMNQRDAITGLAILTTQNDARGGVVQSLGGGGGNGAFNVTGQMSFAKSGAGNIGIGVGGSAGDGGAAGSASAFVTGDIQTQGRDAGAFLLQSVGGGGGNGGFNVTAGITGSKGPSGNLLIGVGGAGGGGGDGGAVVGDFVSDITTFGENSYGLTAQSLGGAGGNGGINVTAGISISGNSSGLGSGVLGIGVGGAGGAGGDGGSVDVDFEGDIWTQSDRAHGALVQSQGGGGGGGAFNVTGGVAIANSNSATVGVGVGGFGGLGGDASTVLADFDGDVTTYGENAYGLTMQSVGGGGGSGGFNVTGGLSITARDGNNAGLNVGIGGFGGGGGDGGNVTGTVTGLYNTSGADADGVLAQSLGGAGGRGGFNISGGLNLGKGNATALAFGLGGFGGGGGTAGDVSLTRVGDTFTRGTQSDGVTAQSIGGGGGAGGFNVTGQIGITLPGGSGSSSNHTAAIGIGGFGGAGGSAGSVNLDLTGNVGATGVDAATFLENQTLGDLAERFDFDIAEQDRPDLITAAIDFVLGLNSDEVEVSDIEWNQRIRVLSNGSNGVVAQSVGGGGGSGGFNIAGNITASTPKTSNNSRGLVIGVGGFGGAGGDASDVTLSIGAPTGATDRVSIVAAGDDKSAVIAQSIGGGGGNGGFNISGNITLDGAATIGVGGFGSAGGVADDVTATVDADLFAQGNSARGLLAQSIGGGGGQGGFNIAAGITGDPNTDESSITVGIGGGGGAGNESGDVDVTQNGQILVDGFNAGGLLAQSVGGGGGDGGFNVSVNANIGGGNTPSGNPLKGYAASVGVGGFGAGGADAGDVSVTSTGAIVVNYAPGTDPISGDPTLTATEFTGYNFGLRAQSIGGGGGTGGINFSGVLARQGNPLAVSVGGSGGSSGDGGAVDVVRGYGATGAAAPSLIQVIGDNSVGLAAESIGGGGGRAGATFLAVGSKKDVNATPLGANILIGGNGGGAGSGGAVTVDHYGDIRMSGEASKGLFAQSIGGGGGNADIAIGTGYTADTSSLNLTIGGAPTAGGTGGDVDVTHVGLITTDGDDAEGLLAQSIGGGGGNTAMSMAVVFGQDDQLSITVGRAGGVGGDSGDVTVDFGDRDARRDASIAGGQISTTGDRSTAIFAQAVGGGGGISSASSVVLSGTENPGDPSNEKVHAVGVSVGADGPNGGIGGDVDVFADGLITTEGYEAHGIHAQSLGGGGGKAGAAMRPTINASSAFNIAVGGTGGNAGLGGDILIDTVAFVETQGEGADGVRAESIGGGGGAGGYAVALGLNFPFFSILTPAESSNTVNLNFGGDGGQGALGGDVEVLNGGFVRTHGIEAHGIAARSIGGGGGEGGMAFTGRMSTSGESNSFDLNVGGSGDVGGDAGDVTVENRGVVVTLADKSHGVLAHSTGGGGGSAGIVGNLDFSRAGGTGNERNFVTINIGGSGGTGGAGGAVRVTNQASTDPTDPDFGVPTGVIETRGDNAYGVFAQSVGGGGGNGASVISIAGTNAGVGSGDEKGAQLSFSLGGSGGSGGTGGTVDVINDGLIQTFGDNSHAIVAQSIGGGGGTGGFALAGTLSINARADAPVFAIGGSGGDGNAAGAVTVTNTGEIRTSGDRSHGILAQSIGGGGGDSQLGLALSGEPISLAISSAISALVGGLNQSSGGLGGDVVVNQSGDIVVSGDGSMAIKAESINGGGGGLTIDFTNIASLTGTPLSVSGPGGATEREFGVQLGGQNAQEQNAGRVTINTDGNFASTGRYGAAAGSSAVGGGGGSYNLWIDVETPSGTTGSGAAPASAMAPAAAPPPGTAMSVSLTLGGSGGVDNDGGDIDTTHVGAVMATGEGSLGVLEQTIGGGGGTATIVVDAPAASVFDAYTVSMGGENGLRERGGSLTRTQNGMVATLGDAGLGALLQSIGGGGGYAVASFSGAGTATLASSVAFGADGGSELGGGDVAGVFSEDVMTAGFGAHGAVLQSIGAGGGFATVLGGADLDVSFGGQNGASGAGGAAGLDVAGSIVTEGAGAFGTLVQSVGGGGGAVLTDLGPDVITVTARSGGAGDGGAASVSVGGSAQTLGDAAIGVAAQSAGGGGLVLLGLEPATGPDAASFGFFAGSAGGAGNGGSVDLDVDGFISTAGDQAFALFGQSVGGNAGAVTASVDGSIATNGAGAHAVLLQSIGGSGGVVSGTLDAPVHLFDGLSAGDGGAISFVHGGDIIALGEGAHGVIAQSLGGGGGWVDGDFAGTAGGAGTGGAIEIEVAGDIFAATENAYAVFAQSLGADGAGDILARLDGMVRGGSGFGAGMILDGGAANHVQLFGSLSAVSGLALDASTGDDFIENNGLFVGNLDLGSGVNAFNNNEGATFIAFDTIDLRDPVPAGYTGRDLQPAPGLTTSIVAAVPVSAGSAAPAAVEPAAATASEPAPVSGETAGLAGGAIAAITPADIADPAPASDPVAFTSGQGGDTGLNGAQQSGLDAAIASDDLPPVANGPAGAARGDSVGDLAVAGVASGLVAAQAPAQDGLRSRGRNAVTPDAISNTGAAPGDASDPGVAAGLVATVPVGTTVRGAPAPGGEAPASQPAADPAPQPAAISAGQPVAAIAPGVADAPVPVTTTADAGLPASAPAGGAASGGFGSAAAPEALPPTPVSMPAAPATFTNAGDFLMGLAAPRFPIDLLNRDTFGNLDGMGDPATNLLYGARVINSVELDGNYVQTATGHLAFDVAFGPYASDIVNVTGDTTVDGTGEVILTWLETDENQTLFATAGTAVDNGLEIADTIAVDFGIEANDIGIQLTIFTDFGQDFLNENGRNLGRHLDSAIRADGSAGIGRLGALLGNLQAGQEDTYSAIFTELDPSGHIAPLQAQLDNAQTFGSELFSCESPVRRVDGQCVWTRLEASGSHRADTFETFEVEADAIHFRGGFEQVTNDLWTVAAAIGYDELSGFRIDTNRMRTQGQALHAGLGFERTSPGGVIVGGGVTAGWQWTESTRSQNIFGPMIGESSANSGYLQTELHLAQVFRSGRLFARPEISASATALHHTGFEERGLEGLGMEGLRETQVIGRISPEVALGAVLYEGPASSATFTMTLGADFQSDRRVELPMRFLGSNPDADPAKIGTLLDSESYRISTDLHLIGSDRIGLRLGYTGEFGEYVEDHRAGFDFRMKF